MEAASAIISIVAGLVSVFLGGFAIWLAFYLFKQDQGTNAKIGELLAGISAQTGMLERITGRQLDRLTKAVTARPSGEETLGRLLHSLEKLPSNIANELRIPKDAEGLPTDENVSLAIMCLYYSAIANTSLVNHAYIDPKGLEALSEHIDMTAADFQTLITALQRTDRAIVNRSQQYRFYATALTMQTTVMTSAQVREAITAALNSGAQAQEEKKVATPPTDSSEDE